MRVARALSSALCIAILGALAFVPSSANATTASTTFTVSAVVSPTCTISAGPLYFGTFSGGLLNSTSTISVTCTNYDVYNVALDPGLATGATTTTRKMSLNGAKVTYLPYTLYSDSGRTVNWGQTIGTDTVQGIGNGAAQTLTVYGQIPAATGTPAGGYTDTITATVTY